MTTHRFAVARRHIQRGFMLVELIVYLGLVALLAVYANQKLANDSEESLAQGSGVYLASVASAAQNLVLTNFNAYANSQPVTGVANPMQPTVAELVNLGRLNGGFPSGAGAMPTRQTAQVNIVRTGCPGASCSVTALVCTTTPVTLGGNTTRFDLASTMVSVQNGTGGQSLYGSGGGTIRGPILNLANPMGAVEGIVCGSGTVDVGMYTNFLQVNDTRNPNFQGSFSVAGTSTFGGAVTISNAATITGTASIGGDTSVGTCAKILAATGRAGFGCTDPNDLPAGYTGGVRAPDVVVNGSVLASTAPSAFTGNNGAYAYVGVAGGAGEVRTSGRAQADRLIPSGLYALNSACAAADEGAIARDSAGSGLVTCRSGLWRSLANYATAGAVCNLPNGSIADDGTGAKMLCMGGTWKPMANLWASGTPGSACASVGQIAYDTANNNEALVCRVNPAGGTARYMRLRDVTSNLVFVQAYEVTDIAYGASGQVAKPSCSAASGMSATPILQLIPKTFSTTDGGFAAYGVDIGGSWQIYLRNGSGATLGGNPNARALANVFCFYA